MRSSFFRIFYFPFGAYLANPVIKNDEIYARVTCALSEKPSKFHTLSFSLSRLTHTHKPRTLSFLNPRFFSSFLPIYFDFFGSFVGLLSWQGKQEFENGISGFFCGLIGFFFLLWVVEWDFCGRRKRRNAQVFQGFTQSSWSWYSVRQYLVIFLSLCLFSRFRLRYFTPKTSKKNFRAKSCSWILFICWIIWFLLLYHSDGFWGFEEDE